MRFCSLNHFPPEKSDVVSNTLEPAWVARAETLDAQRPSPLRDRLLLLSVARLDASEGYKGIDRVMEALPSIVVRFPDLLYCVIGDGDDRARTREDGGKLGGKGACSISRAGA